MKLVKYTQNDELEKRFPLELKSGFTFPDIRERKMALWTLLLLSSNLSNLDQFRLDKRANPAISYDQLRIFLQKIDYSAQKNLKSYFLFFSLRNILKRKCQLRLGRIFSILYKGRQVSEYVDRSPLGNSWANWFLSFLLVQRISCLWNIKAHPSYMKNVELIFQLQQEHIYRKEDADKLTMCFNKLFYIWSSWVSLKVSEIHYKLGV